KGPTVVTDGTNATTPLRVAVTSNGDAHVWLLEQVGVTRKAVKFSDAKVSTVSTISRVSIEAHTIPRVAVSPDGTVGLAWTDTSCNVHFVFDHLASPSLTGADSSGSVRVAECSPQ